MNKTLAQSLAELLDFKIYFSAPIRGEANFSKFNW